MVCDSYLDDRDPGILYLGGGRMMVTRCSHHAKTYENDFADWIYSDSGARGQDKDVKIDTDRYEINRVGYQIWFFGWDNDYMNLPWANTEYATDFSLSGYGDYPEFTWE